ERLDLPNFKGWQIGIQATLNRSGKVLRERWLVPENIDGYEYNEETVVGTNKVTYTERLTPGGDRLFRERVAGRGTVTSEIEVPDNYAAQAVAIRLASRLAQAPQEGPALVTSLETYTQGVCNWLFVPV